MTNRTDGNKGEAGFIMQVFLSCNRVIQTAEGACTHNRENTRDVTVGGNTVIIPS